MLQRIMVTVLMRYEIGPHGTTATEQFLPQNVYCTEVILATRRQSFFARTQNSNRLSVCVHGWPAKQSSPPSPFRRRTLSLSLASPLHVVPCQNRTTSCSSDAVISAAVNRSSPTAIDECFWQKRRLLKRGTTASDEGNMVPTHEASAWYCH